MASLPDRRPHLEARQQEQGKCVVSLQEVLPEPTGWRQTEGESKTKMATGFWVTILNVFHLNLCHCVTTFSSLAFHIDVAAIQPDTTATHHHSSSTLLIHKHYLRTHTHTHTHTRARERAHTHTRMYKR